MATAIKKLNVEPIPDADVKLVQIEYEDGSTAEFTITKEQGYFLNIKTIAKKSPSKVHYQFVRCSASELAVLPQTSCIPSEVTCGLCKTYIKKNLGKTFSSHI